LEVRRLTSAVVAEAEAAGDSAAVAAAGVDLTAAAVVAGGKTEKLIFRMRGVA
jgi:hypothetical protein